MDSCLEVHPIFIYNRMLAERIKSYEKNKDLDIKQIKYPTPAQYKKEFEWLKEVDSLALANAQMNLDKAYTNNYTSNNQNGTVYIENNHIKVPKLKSMIKIKQHHKFLVASILYQYLLILKLLNYLK